MFFSYIRRNMDFQRTQNFGTVNLWKLTSAYEAETIETGYSTQDRVTTKRVF